jgi:hypothetical protein
MMVTDTDYRRMMSSVEIRSATRLRRISSKRGLTCGASNSYLGIGVYARLAAISMSHRMPSTPPPVR